MKKISYEKYLDKVYGCWLGKTIGGAAGAPFEGLKKRINHKGFRDKIDTSLPNDDLDLQIMWLQGLEERGHYLTSREMADLWKEACKYPWSEYGYFMKNYDHGIYPPYSGWFNNEFFMHSMGCPIRSEIWAIAFPGMCEAAGEFAALDATLDHSGTSLWAEKFLAEVESNLFFEDDLLSVIERAIERIDKSEKLYCALNDVFNYFKAGKTFDEGIKLIYSLYSHPDFTHTIQNVSIAVLSLLYGDTDMEKTLDLALSGGYDTDCTCATAGAIIGILKGASGIDEDIKKLANDSYVMAVDVERSDNKISTLAEDCVRVGVSMLISMGNEDIEISNIPEDFIPLQWDAPSAELTMEVLYDTLPAIGNNDTCSFTIKFSAKNNLQGRLSVEKLKDGWQADFADELIALKAGEDMFLPVTVRTDNLKILDQKNIFLLNFTADDGQVFTRKFGIRGATPYKVFGPFVRMANWPTEPGWPPAHGDNTTLPDITAMVHNEITLEESFPSEAEIIEDPEGHVEEALTTIYAMEDVLPLSDVLKLEGECGLIVAKDLLMEEDKKVWVVIGNTDAFEVYINGDLYMSKDEHKFWTPLNNAFEVNLKKGSNKFVIKLLRRTNDVKFSISIKEHKDKHFHQNFWLEDLRHRIV